MHVFSKEQNQLVNIYMCVHKISYAFFYNFVYSICIPKNSIHICILKKDMLASRFKKNLKKKLCFHKCIFL